MPASKRQPKPQPLACILPPHILSAIARNGTEAQRAAALDALSVDHTIRSLRATLGAGSPHPLAAGGVLPTPLPHRTIYDSAHKELSPPTGTVVRQEGSPAVQDAAVNEAYDGLGATFALYLDAFDRNSIDDAGLPLAAYVHFGADYDNAFWDGAEMVFGDGDGTLFNRFTISLDVIGHELTHGVTEKEAGLTYHGQSGALNESVSDVFGSLVKQHALGQSAEAADWLIGACLLAPGVQGRALRDMRNPGTAYDDPTLGKDPQPAEMTGYVTTTKDNGGVHLNSGIPNRAFCLSALAIGGNAWETAGHIWYETLLDARLRPGTQFRGFATITVRHAKAHGSAAATAVTDAWRQVGVLT